MNKSTTTARVIAFVNHKGGVGKTTSVLNIGAGLARRGKKVLMIDMDAQANLTTSMHNRDTEGSLDGKTMFEVLQSKLSLQDVIIPRPNGTFLAPSDLEMAQIAELYATNSSIYRPAEVLKQALQPILPLYDYILIDCAPSLDITTKNAIAAATEAFIPVSAEYLPTKGLTTITQILAGIKRSGINPEIEITGIFLTRYKKNVAICKSVYEFLQEMFGEKLFATKIPENTAITESPMMQQDIFAYSKGSLGAKDYSNLVDEILERHGDLSSPSETKAQKGGGKR